MRTSASRGVRGDILCRPVLSFGTSLAPRIVSVALLCGVLFVPASGITINVNYISGNSVEPATDPTGTLLTAIVQEAAGRWEDIIEDSFTMDINIWWDTAANVNNALAIAPIQTPNGDDTRTVKGDILFNRTSNWFFDSTPSQDEEYAFTQTLFRDLSATDQSNMYNVTTNQQLLEAGFVGTALASAPLQVQTGTDLLSVALHELGHHLGVTNQLLKAQDEWQTDNDYDLPPNLINGALMAARTGDAFGHLAGDNVAPFTIPTLMQPVIPLGTRRLPSATDVFSAAAVGEWIDIDLSRQDLLGGTNWNNPSAWEAAQLPGSADSAFLRLGGTVNLDINDSVASLFVGGGTNFFTGANRIAVGGTTTIDFDGTFPFAQIFVQTGGELETNDLVIDGGELDMEGGLADIQDTVIITKNLTGGNISGFGTVDVQTSLVNNGLISADSGTLVFSSSNAGNVFDLDGALGNGEVRANLGSLQFTGNIEPTFAGQMTIGDGQFIEINNSWHLTTAGELNLNGGITAATAAVLRGADVEIDGDIQVDKRGDILATLQIDPSADFSFPDADDRLTLGGPDDTVTFRGGDFTGNGVLVQQGDAVVAAHATVNINVGTYDWDIGAGADLTSTTLETGAGMIIDVGNLNDPYDGNVTLNSNSLLSVTTSAGSWSYDGTMTFNPTGTGTSMVEGSTLNVTADGLLHFAGGTGVVNPQVSMTGDMLVEGIADFKSTIGFASTSVTTLNGGILRFNGSTNYNGSTFTGTGSIQQNGTGFIVDSQTININGIFDWDGATNDSQFFVNPGKSFNLTSTTINSGNNIYSGQLTNIGGIVTINVDADAWTMAGTLNMTSAFGQGAIILGDAVDITGHVQTNTSDAHFFSAPSTFLAGSTTTVSPNTQLQFNAPVIWEDGTHSGGGLIGVNDTGTINGGSVDIATLEVGGAAIMTVNGGDVTATDFTKQTGGILRLNGGSFTVDGGTGVFNSSLTYSGPDEGNQPTFNVTGGADVSYTFAWRVGEDTDEFGALVVSGSGGGQASTLRATGGGGGADVVVAEDGDATMDVNSGGHVIAGDDFIIGRNMGADGVATVSGIAGGFRSTVSATRNGEADNDLMIGGGESSTGGFGTLNILDGGLVNLSGRIRLAETVGASATVNVSGASGATLSTLQADGDLFVGTTATTAGGPALVSVDGGQLSVGGTTRISGPSGRVNVLNGTVTTGDTIVGFGQSSSQGSILVEGLAASWQVNGTLTVGDDQAIGQVLVRDSATLIATDIFVADAGTPLFTIPPFGHLKTTTGGAITATNSLVVGDDGTGIAVVQGGPVNSTTAIIGRQPGSNGFVKLFEGVLSTWTNTGNVYVGGNQDGTLQGTGSVQLSNTGSCDGGLCPSDPTMNVDGMMVIYAGGSVSLDAGAIDAATIDHTHGGTFDFTGGTLSVDLFDGELVQDGGVLAPGDSPGTTQITGNYLLDAGTVAIEIGETTPGIDFDQVLIDGDVTIGAAALLELTLIEHFVPDPTDSFTILDAGGLLADEFGNAAAGQRLAILGGEGSFVVNYDSPANAVLLSDFLVALPGDFNGDFDVDGADFLEWQRDPSVGDLTDWQTNYGPTGSLAATASVPEPSCLLLTLLAISPLVVKPGKKA